MSKSTLDRRYHPNSKMSPLSLTGALPNTSWEKIDNALYQTRCNIVNAGERRDRLNREAESIATMPSETLCDIPLHWLMHPYLGYQSRAANMLCNKLAVTMSKKPFRLSSLLLLFLLSRATEEMERHNIFIRWLNYRVQSNSKELSYG